eukprot:GILI01034464.1.p1 GENE.GILI01034464.1~~GILI01034464.1.p1  ORF type:complete len:173 (-),score=12.09 GILI01034464.1:371-889(-)
MLPTLLPRVQISIPNPFDSFPPFGVRKAPWQTISSPASVNSLISFSPEIRHDLDYHSFTENESESEHASEMSEDVKIPSHGGKANKTFVCHYCRKVFKQQYNLTRHIRIHTGCKPFTCNFDGCFKSFTTASVLRTHQRVHTGERPYVCSHKGCGKAFSQKGHLSRHCKVHSR